MAVTPITVEGLKPLVRDLGKIDSEIPKQMRRDMLAISQRVTPRVKARGQALGGVHAHAVRRGLRGGATQNTAWIKLVATREPSVLGAEFGGGRRPTTRQFPPWRGSGGGAGYFMYPTLRSMTDEIGHQLATAIDHMLDSAGFH